VVAVVVVVIEYSEKIFLLPLFFFTDDVLLDHMAAHLSEQKKMS